MAHFAYTARDSNGAAVTGTLAADSQEQVQQMLRGDGKYATSIRPATSADGGPASGAIPARGIRISRTDVIQVATQLSIMIETGVVLSEALDCIAKQAEKPKVKALVEDLGRCVQEGSDFSFALSRHPRTFSRMFIAIIRASEKSGMLARLLNRATAYLRDEQDTVRKVRGALTYPAMMMAFCLSTTIFLLAYVLPKFTAIYASKKKALPVPTKVLMALSGFLIGHWALILVGAAVGGTGGLLFFRSGFGSRVWDYVQLRIPLLGRMYRKLHLSRGLRMIGTLASAGVTLTECVSTAQDLCANSFFRDLWSQVSLEITAGKQLSEPLFESSLVPRSVAQMLHSGEKSGKLGFVMEQVAGFAEVELKEQISNLTRYIEPLMIVVMGFIIGGVAMALLLPIFTISRVMAS